MDGGDFDNMMSMIESWTRDNSSAGNCSHSLTIADTVEVRISFLSNRNFFGTCQNSGLRSYGSHVTCGCRGDCRRVQDVASTYVLRPRMGTGVSWYFGESE